ncbi:uncharacterized protein [Ovis canadensis]|uniref:uncharacterized protein isoform X4 n=1 Tax=Ovis canadensis TaxID=37174 RepID=UPI003750C2C4
MPVSPAAARDGGTAAGGFGSQARTRGGGELTARLEAEGCVRGRGGVEAASEQSAAGGRRAEVLNRRQPWRSCGPVLGDTCLDLGAPTGCPGAARVKTLPWMSEGCACSQQQGWKPGDPGPSQTEGQDPTAAPVTQRPRHRQPLTDGPASAAGVWGTRPPSCKDPGVTVVVPIYVASELRTPLKNILGFSLSFFPVGKSACKGAPAGSPTASPEE